MDAHGTRLLYLPDKSGGSQVTMTPAALHLGLRPTSQRPPSLSPVVRRRSHPKTVFLADLRGRAPLFVPGSHGYCWLRRFLGCAALCPHRHTQNPLPDWSGRCGNTILEKVVERLLKLCSSSSRTANPDPQSHVISLMTLTICAAQVVITKPRSPLSKVQTYAGAGCLCNGCSTAKVLVDSMGSDGSVNTCTAALLQTRHLLHHIALTLWRTLLYHSLHSFQYAHQPTRAPLDMASTVPAELPAYYVFAMEGYTMLLYDGGRDDHQVYIHSHIRLFNPFPSSRPIGFTGYVDRIVQYQQHFAVLAIIPEHLPQCVVLMGVRYQKLGGLYGYLALTFSKVLDIVGHLPPDSTHTIPIADAMNPLDVALRSEHLVRMPTSPASVRIGAWYVNAISFGVHRTENACSRQK